MPRVKRGLMHVKHRRNILKATAGFKLGRKKLIKLAKTAATKAGQHAYVDRRKKKRTIRGLWNIKINASAREVGLKYGALIHDLKDQKIMLNRKMLASLGEHQSEIFKQLVMSIKK